MNKAQIKTICEADDKLEWWAMVLFAEISDLMEQSEYMNLEYKSTYNLLKQKVAEFP